MSSRLGKRPVVLIVDDDVSIGEFFSELLVSQYDVIVAHTGEDGLRRHQESAPDVILLDVRLPDISGIDVLERIQKTPPPHPVTIMITANRDVESAVKAMKSGAREYLLKPFGTNDELLIIIERAIEERRLRMEVKLLRGEVKQFFSPDSLIGKSAGMKNVRDKIDKVIENNITVLIRGDSGTGKEMVAKAIHYGGPRSSKPFVALNCAAIPDNLLESELFGHEKGAFTGATNFRKGKFEMADSGTLFMDEIGSMDYNLQAKLLRALQEKEVERVGGSKSIPVDVRIISATSRNLEESIQEGSFRDDLFYRINVMTIYLPSLRERIEDIPLLAEHFLKKHAPRLGSHVQELTHGAMQKLMEHSWPGNVRELENTIERAIIYCDGSLLLPENIEINAITTTSKASHTQKVDVPTATAHSLDDAEKGVILQALENTGFNISRAADILGVTRKTLRSKMVKYGIQK